MADKFLHLLVVSGIGTSITLEENPDKPTFENIAILPEFKDRICPDRTGQEPFDD